MKLERSGIKKLWTTRRRACSRLFNLVSRHSLVVSLTSLCALSGLCVSVVNTTTNAVTTETQTVRREIQNRSYDLVFARSLQGPEHDYSKFIHTSQRHTSLACTACHERVADNSTTPRFPGHKACTGCHLAQFVTPAIPMCQICHSNVQNSNPPLNSFPAKFDENFNVKFDHAQHMSGGARPPTGCAACHSALISRGAGLAIPSGLKAHSGCYSCHTPSSKSPGGREIASCGVCHDQKPYSRTATTARAFRFAFSHAQHGPRQRLGCVECHSLTAGLPQSRQVSSPSSAEHFPQGRTNCLTCHNGKRSFGGDLAFRDCRRCHTGQTFRMPG